MSQDATKRIGTNRASHDPALWELPLVTFLTSTDQDPLL
jgi:hypothetical protein